MLAFTPLHRAAGSFNSAEADMLTALLAAGAEIEARDDLGRTPLQLAAEFAARPDRVQALLAAGADPSATSDDGMTALDYARRNTRGSASEIERLLSP